MSLNFSIESILRHGNVETPNSTLILSSNQLNQTNFLNENADTFLKKHHLNYLNPTNVTNTNPTNFNNLISNQVNHLNDNNNNNNLLESPLFYLNKSNKSNHTPNLMDVQASLNYSNALSSSLNLDLNKFQLSQFNQFQNQLNRFDYLQKFTSLYNNHQSNLTNSENNYIITNGHTFHQLNLHFSNSSNDKQTDKSTSETNSSNTLLLSNASSLLCNTSNLNGNTGSAGDSPLSDKSSEILLNYEDSLDSNRMSQHSGNNVSINSNNSNSNHNNSFGNKDAPLCTKCKLHGIRSQVKGHKKNCPKKDCVCDLCVLTDYGKRLRGKKVKKNAENLLLNSNTNDPAAANNCCNLANAQTNLSTNFLMMEGLNESTLNTVNDFLNTTSQAHECTLKEAKNLNSKNCLPVSTPILSSNSQASHLNVSHQSGLNFLQKSAIKECMKVVINLLKEKLQQDGLNYEQELAKLKYSVIYLLLTRLDKSDLYNKFLMEV